MGQETAIDIAFDNNNPLENFPIPHHQPHLGNPFYDAANRFVRIRTAHGWHSAVPRSRLSSRYRSPVNSMPVLIEYCLINEAFTTRACTQTCSFLVRLSVEQPWSTKTSCQEPPENCYSNFRTKAHPRPQLVPGQAGLRLSIIISD